MNTLTKNVYKLRPPGGIFDMAVVTNLFPDRSEGARALLVRRSIESGEIVRLKPGLYCLGKEYRSDDPHPFTVANMLYRPSYVSLETALGYHGLIPEAVYQVASVSERRTRRFDTPLGNFTYERVPAEPFLAGVTSVEIQKDVWIYMSSPLRAVADIIYLRKIDWRDHGVKFLTDSMRIDEDALRAIDTSRAEEICRSLGSHRVRTYIKKMVKELAP